MQALPQTIPQNPKTVIDNLKMKVKLREEHLKAQPVFVKDLPQDTKAWIPSRALVYDTTSGFVYVPKRAVAIVKLYGSLRGLIEIQHSILGYELLRMTDVVQFTPHDGKPSEEKYLPIAFITYV